MFYENIGIYIEAIIEVKDANLEAFYIPFYAPSEDGDHMVTYHKCKLSYILL